MLKKVFAFTLLTMASLSLASPAFAEDAPPPKKENPPPTPPPKDPDPPVKYDPKSLIPVQIPIYTSSTTSVNFGTSVIPPIQDDKQWPVVEKGIGVSMYFTFGAPRPITPLPITLLPPKPLPPKPPEKVPEPVTTLGSVVAIGFGTFLRKKYSRQLNKQALS